MADDDITREGCSILIGDAAINMVDAAFDRYSAFATSAYSLATQEINNLHNYTISPVAFGVGYDLDPSLTSYVRPSAPDVPGDMTYNAPPAPPEAPTFSLPAVSFDSAPTAPANAVPAIQEFAQPGNLTATAPNVNVELSNVSIPVRPDYVLPDVPTLAALNLPAAPTLNLPTFDGVRPNTDLTPPIDDFSFTPEQYTSALLDKVSGRVDAMLDGYTGLPAPVLQALHDRAFAAIDGQEFRAVQQAVEEYAARGFSQPSGILNRRLAEVRQNNQNQRNAAARDIYVQDQQAHLENLRFAVTQGIALQSTLIQAHNEEMRISLDAAQVALNMRLRVFEAQVSLANFNLQVYQTDAQVWRERLQGELAKLDVYRTELSALQVQGQLNQQQVEIYTAQLRGVETLAELYRDDIAAAQLVVSTNQQQIDLERSKIQMYAEQVNAWRTQWDGYRAQLESNTVRANIYSLVEQGYATQVRAWSETQQQKVSQQQLAISSADLGLRTWSSKIDLIKTQIQAETERLNALDGIYRSKVAAYSASAQVESAASDANQRSVQLLMTNERNRTDIAIQNAQTAINQLIELNRLLVTVKQGIATTSAQLAASSMSAVNFGAHVTSGRSMSQSCGTSFSYSGSLDDAEATS